MPRPPLRAFDRAVDLGEQVEHPGQHLARNADAGVPTRIATVVPVALGVQSDLAAGRRVLGRVVQQVCEHLREPRRVGVQNRQALRGSVTVS